MLTVEIDGNDGTGKTYLINKLRDYLFINFNYDWKLNRDIVFEDRGVLSVATLSEEWNKETPDITRTCKLSTENTIYILIDDTPVSCQKRIKERGDSIEEEYHTLDDLIKYRERFNKLRETFFTEIIYVSKNGEDFTDADIHTLALAIITKHNLMLRNELIKTKSELKVYKDQYGDIDFEKYIRVTKTNLQVTLIKITDIIKNFNIK